MPSFAILVILNDASLQAKDYGQKLQIFKETQMAFCETIFFYSKSTVLWIIVGKIIFTYRNTWSNETMRDVKIIIWGDALLLVGNRFHPQQN